MAVPVSVPVSVSCVSANCGCPRFLSNCGCPRFLPFPLPVSAPHIAQIVDGDFKKEPPVISRTNYGDAAVALHAALWGFSTTNNFTDGMLAVVNLGWDADTMGAVYGQLAGAYYGEDGIPAEWSDKVFKHDTIISFADTLHALAQKERPA